MDEGQTTFRLRHAYGELGAFGAGQTWSPFMDPDVFPNSLEYWGPTGMVFFRNVQVRWMPIKGDTRRLMLALERPGASGDQGIYADRIELDGIKARFPLPDFSGAYKYTQDWGYVRAAGILRRIKWDDTLDDAFDLSGDATGWGVNLSSNLKLRQERRPPAAVRLRRRHPELHERLAGRHRHREQPLEPGDADRRRADPDPWLAAVPRSHLEREVHAASVGYSRQDNDNTDGQAPDAFRIGQYALGNLLYYPVPNVMMGGELQWGRRENFSDGFQSDGFKLQFSFKYNFSWKLGG